jgi:hypothetical protein
VVASAHNVVNRSWILNTQLASHEAGLMKSRTMCPID